MSIEKYIQKKEKEIEDLSKEVEGIKKLLKIYPDLKYHTNRWGTIRLYSKSVNPDTTSYDMGHNCGCCDDSPLEVWPYIEIDGLQIYSDPPIFMIGEKDSWSNEYSESAYPGWDKEMGEAKISKTVIDKIKEYMLEHSDWEDWDE